MIRLVPTWNITPKDGVAEKFDVNQNKKWNIFFGILEFSNIYTLVMIIINLFRRHAEHVERTADLHFIIQAIPYVQTILALSIIATGILSPLNSLSDK